MQGGARRCPARFPHRIMLNTMLGLRAGSGNFARIWCRGRCDAALPSGDGISALRPHPWPTELAKQMRANAYITGEACLLWHLSGWSTWPLLV